MKIDLSKYNFDVITGAGLCSKIASYGYEAYLVGGCVRDMVMECLGLVEHANVHDVDIATNMPINELKREFKTASNNGEAHGTILVEWCGIYFEVTQFRTDGAYTDGRHPDSVSFTNSFKEDTARRDFTINAMGIDSEGNVIDHYNGIKCLEDHVLSTVGNPAERFDEDALRIIRAYRFQARFKMAIPEDVKEAIRKTKHKLANIAMERIYDEFKKCIGYGHVEFANMIRFMIDDGIFEIIDPKGYINANKAWQLLSGRAIRTSNGMGEFFTDLGSLTCLLWGSDLRNAYQHYKMENEVFKCAQWCFNHLDAYHVFGEDIVLAVEMVGNRYFNQLRELDDAVTGHLIDFATYNKIGHIADFVKTYTQDRVLSSAIAKCGYQGKAFGEMLYKLKLWHYTRLRDNCYYEDDVILEHRAIEYIKSMESVENAKEG